MRSIMEFKATLELSIAHSHSSQVLSTFLMTRFEGNNVVREHVCSEQCN